MAIIKEDPFGEMVSFRTFCRSFALPASAEADRIKAVHEKGILKVTVPKDPEIKPKKIPILQEGKQV